MPNIAQQDYIIIDWELKNSSNAAKKAEVDAQLKNIYLANPLALFSVVFINYSGIGICRPFAGLSDDGHSVDFVLVDSTLSPETYSFDID